MSYLRSCFSGGGNLNHKPASSLKHYDDEIGHFFVPIPWIITVLSNSLNQLAQLEHGANEAKDSSVIL